MDWTARATVTGISEPDEDGAVKVRAVADNATAKRGQKKPAHGEHLAMADVRLTLSGAPKGVRVGDVFEVTATWEEGDHPEDETPDDGGDAGTLAATEDEARA